jgi:aminoglycoside phosphotransferase (APT) family kinase protein
MAVRMPRIAWAIGQVDKEHRWLPRLARRLPLAIPVPLAKGSPGEGYPWNWSVCRWLDGENATLDRLHDHRQAATDLAGFVTALWKIDPTDGPTPGTHNFGRGVPLKMRDVPTRAAIAALHDTLDTDALTRAWDAALAAPVWGRAPVWVHGDLQSGNLLTLRGRLSAVIDFGGLGVGDPACDLMVAWNLFSGAGREAFREHTQADDATWDRGRGWALSVALIALPYYRSSNPSLAGMARRTIDEVLAELEFAA